MAHLMRKVLLLVLMLNAITLIGQENCKVLKSTISATYKGECKNGLAHGQGIATGVDSYEGNFKKGYPEGKGIYSWADGSKYVGEWKGGMRHGTGTYTFHIEDRDSIQRGLWSYDEYAGEKFPAPGVAYSTGVDRYNFKKHNSGLNRVLVDIYQNGSRSKNITGFNMTSSSGTDLVVSQSVGFNNVEFPVTIKMFYNTQNKLNQMVYTVKFDFVIYEPGDWTVEIHN